MVMVLLVCLLAGAVLGQRFKVLVLLPAMVPAGILAILVAALQGPTIWRLVVTAFVAVLSLQLGYIAGIAIRHLAIVDRADRLRLPKLTTAASRQPARQIADGNSRPAI